MAEALKLDGKDNSGKPRQEFANRIAEYTDSEFVKEAEKKIWLSAYASNNPGSDYHWQADAYWSEAQRRGKPDLYETAWKRAAGQT